MQYSSLAWTSPGLFWSYVNIGLDKKIYHEGHEGCLKISFLRGSSCSSSWTFVFRFSERLHVNAFLMCRISISTPSSTIAMTSNLHGVRSRTHTWK